MTAPKAAEVEAERALIQAALQWADWCAGQGICAIDPAIADPEDFLMAYSDATGDEAWDTLHLRTEEAVMIALDEEREIIAKKAREWAENYPPHSDGWNTFCLFAEWVESRP